MSSILRAGGARKLIQSISQFALKPGEEEIKKRAGGSSGGEIKNKSLQLP